MNTKYNHKEIELGKNQKWIDKEMFSSHDLSKQPFSIILPPPNITGKLHIGHAWDGFIQDTVIRYKKLKGFDVMWVPGMDHAGIATQAKVEQKLRENNEPGRYDLGREKFLEKIISWKEEYATEIRKQWGTLGLALDYKNERFTMDDGLSDAVTKVFIKMYEDGLIYRGNRAINWDPELQTVLSNIEVINKETESTMFYIKLAIKDSEETIQVATTRPETMFSDVAIAVNPEDDKMNQLIGKEVLHPLTGKILPIIGDDYIKVGKGTGAMKVSAHAQADIEIIQKNELEVIECIDKNGKMNSITNELEGTDRFEARKTVIEILEKSNMVAKKESISNAVSYSERSGAIIETLMMPQWFVNMKPLSKKLIKDLESESGVKFYPNRFEEVITTWMENINDWAISRQLWWGHRIPAWYKGEEIKVQVESPGSEWKQDEDVLDTWFSSGLAPFSFLGWPEESDNVKRYYPTSLLVTGYDIIFFWVARMYFQGLEFMGEKPFNEVLIHGLIRAEDGKKMSKSLGNGIDPMDVVEQYGADSLRWFLLTNSTPGQDIRYSPQKIEAAWGLANKLWNISRYILEIMPDSNEEETDADKWILEKLSKLKDTINSKMESYEFTIIGKELTSFIMEDFSSWYIEFTKTIPNKKIAIKILEELLIVLHPFMPNITDHIYSMIEGNELLNNEWPETEYASNAEYINRVILIVKAIREFRNTNDISNKIELFYQPTISLNTKEEEMIKTIGNASIKENKDAVVSVGEFEIYIELSSDQKDKENSRIEARVSIIKEEIIRAEKMLSNESFTSKAPVEKIKEEEEKLNSYKDELKILQGEQNG